MNDKIKQEIAEDIDTDGLWYWIWQGFYRRFADKLPVELLKRLISLNEEMESLRKFLQDEGYLL